MKEFDRTDSGVLFKNDRKLSDRHPDYTGSINIHGTDYFLSAWLKEGKSGKFLSLALGKEKGERTPARKPSRRDDDDLEF